MDKQRIRIPQLAGYAVDPEGNLWKVDKSSRSSRSLRGLIHDKPYGEPRTLEQVGMQLGKAHSPRGMAPRVIMPGLWELSAPDYDTLSAGWRGNLVDYLSAQVWDHTATPWFVVTDHKRPIPNDLRVFLETHGGLSLDMRERLPCIVAGRQLFNALICKHA
jgi:hypothetical protein